jgi:hypothetical protein
MTAKILEREFEKLQPDEMMQAYVAINRYMAEHLDKASSRSSKASMHEQSAAKPTYVDFKNEAEVQDFIDKTVAEWWDAA